MRILSIAQVMFADFFRRSRWHFLIMTLIPLGAVAGILIYLDPNTGRPLPGGLVRSLYHIALFAQAFSMIIFMAIPTNNSGNMQFPRRLFLAPVSTTALVTLSMAPFVAGIAAVQIAFSAGFRIMTGVWAPIVGPMLVWTLATVWLLAFLWATLWRQLFLFLGGSALFTVGSHLLCAHESWWTALADLCCLTAGGRGPAWFVLAGVALAIAGVWRFTVTNVTLDRSGGADRIAPKAGRKKNAESEWLPPFASAEAAYFQMEWSQYSLFIPTSLIMALMFVPDACNNLTSDAHKFMDNVGMLAVLFPPIGPIWSLTYYLHSAKKEKNHRPCFFAMLPMSDRAMAYLAFKAQAISLTFTTLALWAFAFLVAGGLILTGYETAVYAFFVDRPLSGIFDWAGSFWLIALITAQLLIGWTFMGLGIMLLRFRNDKMSGWVGMAFAGAAPWLLVLSKFMPDSLGAWLSRYYPPFLIGGLCLLVATAAIRTEKKRIIGSGLTWIAAAIFAATGALAAMAFLLKPAWPHPLYGWLIGVGLAAFALAPLTLGPLAVHWNRHR